MDKVMTKRCKRCGAFVNNYRKYCEECSSIVDKEKGRIRKKRYRERYNNAGSKQWDANHPDKRRLTARNYIHKHKEEMKLRLQQWRKKNKDKVKEQNRRAYLKRKIKEIRRIYHNGFRKPVTIPGKIVNCLDCGKEVKSQKGQRNYKKYCDECIKKRQIATRVRYNKEFKKANPNYDREWRASWTEKIVAVTCSTCGNLIIYDGKGCLPHKCGLCRCIEKSKHKRYPDPVDTVKFIEKERWRVGLNSNKRWTKTQIDSLFRHYYPEDK